MGGCTPFELIQFTVEIHWYAVIERGHGCSFLKKIHHAEMAGASGVIITNDEEYGMQHGKGKEGRGRKRKEEEEGRGRKEEEEGRRKKRWNVLLLMTII